MPPYHRPETLDDALALLSRGDLQVAAGCTDLFPATDRPALQGPILDITGISSLRGISQSAGSVRIGATTTWTDLIHADLPPAFDMLKEAAREVGSIQIQNAGTIAGNLCNASPAADGVPCLLALDAEVELTSQSGKRQIPLSAFVTGTRQTALAPGELVTCLTIPETSALGRSRFRKLGARKYLVISIAMVAVRLVEDQGRIAKAAIAVGSCSAVAARLPGLEVALIGQPVTSDLAAIVEAVEVAPHIAPISDIRADAAYRQTAAVHLIRRALQNLLRPRAGVAA